MKLISANRDQYEMASEDAQLVQGHQTPVKQASYLQSPDRRSFCSIESAASSSSSSSLNDSSIVTACEPNKLTARPPQPEESKTINSSNKKKKSIVDSNLNQKRQIKVRTCADVYEHLRTCKRFYKKRAPKDGLEFKIDYLDTGLAMGERERERAPVVLALHGAPGSYKDFALLIEHLSGQNVRVIAPNFPEYTATVETKVLFRHSADEKAAYLRDFLLGIQVTKIDLLVSHSSAIFPTLLILLNANKRLSPLECECEPAQSDSELGDNLAITSLGEQADEKCIDPGQYSARARKIRKNLRRESRGRKKHRDLPPVVRFEQPIEIRALALLNPAGHRMPMSMKPCWFKCGGVRWYQNEYWRYLYRKVGPTVLTWVGVPVKVDNMDNVMLSATVMRNSRCRRVVTQLEQLAALKLPTLLVFSENDKLIEKEIFYEMTQFMGLNPSTFDTYDNEGKLTRNQSNEADWIRVMVFKAGGHYAYSNYPETVNRAISDLLSKQQEQKQRQSGQIVR